MIYGSGFGSRRRYSIRSCIVVFVVVPNLRCVRNRFFATVSSLSMVFGKMWESSA